MTTPAHDGTRLLERLPTPDTQRTPPVTFPTLPVASWSDTPAIRDILASVALAATGDA